MGLDPVIRSLLGFSLRRGMLGQGGDSFVTSLVLVREPV